MSVSRHRVDELIRTLLATGRPPAADEVEQILERLAAAPFHHGSRAIPPELQGLAYGGRTIRAREDSLFAHVVKRVLDERQWAGGTIAADYLDDLRRAVRHRSARLAIYEERGGPIAATVTPTGAAVPPRHAGPRSLGLLLVVYSADRGTIISGYQISSVEAARIPQEARWLT